MENKQPINKNYKTREEAKRVVEEYNKQISETRMEIFALATCDPSLLTPKARMQHEIPYEILRERITLELDVLEKLCENKFYIEREMEETYSDEKV